MPTNALIGENSPYLLQHAHNPVDWMPWGQAAFEKARREEKPIFLSIGYSTCHWCHVMERESFENDEIAAILNNNFVSIKVDREERPDVDRIYMLFVQATSGGGGWPMSVWLTPELRPFFGGTYFPPDSRYGRPGFGQVLTHIANAWKDNRAKMEASSEEILKQLANYAATPSEATELNQELFESALPLLRRSFDAEWGGFGSAPKFPRPSVFNYLFRIYATGQDSEALEMTTFTLRKMASGGMSDHLGGGFHRYSVDRFWFVPHFEKMLYDQAQLAVSYLEAYQITDDPSFAGTARSILDYVLRDMRHPEGGFYSAEDADSADPERPGHKVEGAFYVWKQSEIDALLGNPSAAWFSLRYGVRPDGNVEEDPHGEFIGRNILSEAVSVAAVAQEYRTPEEQVAAGLEQARDVLFDARSHRPHPYLDDKILTSWNGLMISALAKGGVLLAEPRYSNAARTASRFLMTRMCSPETGSLQRRFRNNNSAIPAFLDDYVFIIQALLDLYEAEFQVEDLQAAVDLATDGLKAFEDTESGGFFSTAAGDSDLVLRLKDDYDGAEPSGNSVATDVLLRLAHLTGVAGFQERAERSLLSFSMKLRQQPVTAPQMLVALGRWLTEPAQTVIRCRERNARVEQLLQEERRVFRPYSILLVITDEAAAQLRGLSEFLAGLDRKGEITIYRCANFVCQLPQVIDE